MCFKFQNSLFLCIKSTWKYWHTYTGMGGTLSPEKMVLLNAKKVVHFRAEQVVHFRAEWVVHFVRNRHYWKGKFCSSSSPSSTGSHTNEHSEAFAPVRFSVPQRHLAPSTAEDLQESRNEIMLELPSGIKIHFRGANESKVALGIINQICSTHVLPQ